MLCWNSIGYAASTLVLLAFAVKDIVPLRTIAIASNVAFLAYGIALGLTPVWLLHALLLPLNAWRLREALRTAPETRRPHEAARAAALPAHERGRLLPRPVLRDTRRRWATTSSPG